MRLLVTAFEPFGGELVNPAQQVSELLPDRIGAFAVARVDLPTVFSRCVPVAADAIDRLRPDAVLCLGQAGGRRGLTIERVAINVDDAEAGDNAGDRPVDRPIEPGGPAAVFCTLPIKEMAAAMREGGYAASISNSAGTFVCNHLLYGVLRHLARRRWDVPAGFIHLPYLPEQAAARNAPDMPAAEMAAALLLAIPALEAHLEKGRSE